MKHKECRGCERVLPIQAFYPFMEGERLRYSSRCRPCHKQMVASRAEKKRLAKNTPPRACAVCGDMFVPYHSLHFNCKACVATLRTTCRTCGADVVCRRTVHHSGECKPCSYARRGIVHRTHKNIYRWHIERNVAKMARGRGLMCTLSPAYVKACVGEPCTYCGLPPERPAPGTGLVIWGFDRVDNSKGYSDSNAVPCCLLCNQMKNKWSIDQFLQHVRRIADNCFPED